MTERSSLPKIVRVDDITTDRSPMIVIGGDLQDFTSIYQEQDRLLAETFLKRFYALVYHVTDAAKVDFRKWTGDGYIAGWYLGDDHRRNSEVCVTAEWVALFISWLVRVSSLDIPFGRTIILNQGITIDENSIIIRSSDYVDVLGLNINLLFKALEEGALFPYIVISDKFADVRDRYGDASGPLRYREYSHRGEPWKTIELGLSEQNFEQIVRGPGARPFGEEEIATAKRLFFSGVDMHSNRGAFLRELNERMLSPKAEEWMRLAYLRSLAFVVGFASFTAYLIENADEIINALSNVVDVLWKEAPELSKEDREAKKVLSVLRDDFVKFRTSQHFVTLRGRLTDAESA